MAWRDPDAGGQVQRHDLGAADGVLVVHLRELDDPEGAVPVPGVDLGARAAEGTDSPLEKLPAQQLGAVLPVVDRVGLERARLGDHLFQVEEPGDRGPRHRRSRRRQGPRVRAGAVEVA